MATTVIGIGTSGLGVLEAAQQFNYEFTEQNTPEEVEYVVIDSEKASAPKSTAIGKTAIQKIPIPLDGIQGEVEKLRNNKNFDDSWFPSKFKVVAESGAAGGRPTYGRLGLWVYYSDIVSYLDKFSTKEGNKRVLVVGSLTGGTGSGICVDLGYLIRERLPNADLQAVFMVPSESNYSEANKVVYENAFQALRSLEYYSISENIYQMVTPDGVSIKNPKAPYDLVSVVSQDYDQSNNAVLASKMANLSSLISSVGLYVSSIFLPGEGDDLKGRLEERRNDAKQVNEHMLHFSSFGVGLAQYPRKILEEYVALDYSTEIINNWKTTEVKSNKTENRAKRNLENQVNKAIEDTLNIVVNNKNLDEYVSFVADQIIQSKYEEHSDIDAYLSDLLNTDGVIYDGLKKNLKEAKNNVIKGINNDLKEELKEPYINIGKEYINALASHLDNENKKGLLTFWEKTYKINGENDRWPKIFKSLKERLKNELTSAKVFFQDYALLEERITDIVTLLKMNLLYPELKKIGESIKDSDMPLYAEGEQLINVDTIKKLEYALDELLNASNTESLTSRQSHIQANNTSYAQVFYYYKKVDFDGEIEDIKKKIEGEGGIDTSGKTLLNGASLFEFLAQNNSESKGIKNLYFSILPEMMGLVSRKLPEVQEQSNDIYSLIMNQSKENSISYYLAADDKDLKMSPPAFMAHADPESPHGAFNYSHCMRLMYGSNELGKVEKTANQLRHENKGDKKITDEKPDDNAVKIPNLDDAIIIFREYAYYGNGGDVRDQTLIPTRDIKSLALVKENMLENVEKDEFVTNRLPYFSQLKQKGELTVHSEFKKSASHDT